MAKEVLYAYVSEQTKKYFKAKAAAEGVALGVYLDQLAKVEKKRKKQ